MKKFQDSNSKRDSFGTEEECTKEQISEQELTDHGIEWPMEQFIEYVKRAPQASTFDELKNYLTIILSWKTHRLFTVNWQAFP